MKNLLLFTLIFAGLFLLIDLFQRKYPSSGTWSRKATHIGGGTIAVFLPQYLDRNLIVLIAALFTILLLVSRVKMILTLHRVNRSSIGEILFPASIGVVALITVPENIKAYSFAVLVLSFSDGLAGLIGEKLQYGEVKVFGNIKSAGGSAVFFTTTLILLILLFGWDPGRLPICLLIAVFLTFIEFISLYGTDNLIIPVLSAILAKHILLI